MDTEVLVEVEAVEEVVKRQVLPKEELVEMDIPAVVQAVLTFWMHLHQ